MIVRRSLHQTCRHKTKCTLFVTACLALFTATAFAQTTVDESIDLSSPDRAMIEQDTKQILNRPEFRHLTRERQITGDAAFDLEDLVKDQTQSEPRQVSPVLAGIVGMIFRVLSYAAIICACGLILFLLYRSIAGFRYSRQLKDETDDRQLQGEVTFEQIVSPAESEVSIYLERAKALAQTGDYHNAIIQLIYGSMSFIERAGWIRFRKGLTYRDYLRAARPHGLPGDSFRQIIRTYEPLGFGRREATREHFESTLQFYESAFQKKA
ncbi:hypothetical protein Pan241w_54860 [Gimesia alba]|uniref:Protein-glutamine gamma-glutamyltransferase-like C-terminal domain-containing protein n=1 Tax=Gimesia alba TaxID=2527973 RepID=A0A517RNA4_9PLAN|nr:DUF4129 domain-containing protein [Gimesia alba]QDT45366.1 hypothetical protein Pan241w_54860 [Gimesia alba]